MRSMLAVTLLCVVGCSQVIETINLSSAFSAEDLYINGKFGRVCSSAALPAAIVLDVVLLPVTWPLGCILQSSSDKGMMVIFVPGGGLQFVVFSLGSMMALPVHAAAEALPEALETVPSDLEARAQHLLERLPYLSKHEYELLVAASGRTAPEEYRMASLESSVTRFLLGLRPKVSEWVANGWRTWADERNAIRGQAESVASPRASGVRCISAGKRSPLHDGRGARPAPPLTVCEW